MKIGIHLSLWTSNWTDVFLEYIDLAATLGFDLIELPLMDPKSLPISEIKERLEDNNLAVFCGTGLSAFNDISSPDPEIREKGLEHLINCLELAHCIGSPLLGGVIHSAWGKKERVREEDRKHSAIILKKVAQKAQELDMNLCLECINRYENSFLNTTEQGLHMLELIGMSNVGLHLDTFHMNIEERSIPESIKKAEKKLFHLHLSENNRGFPGNGSINWKEIFKTLYKIKYSGSLVIESYIFPNTSIGDDVCIWRSIELDTKKSLRKSLNFIRSFIKK